MRILGIDPGFAITGYSIIDYIGNKFKLIASGAVLTKAGVSFPLRLTKLYDDLTKIINEYKPDAISVEELFFNQNITTGIQVAQARGVILLALAQKGLSPVAYSPSQVKMSVVGYGKAEKRQVMEMTRILLGLEKVPRPDDAADALAVALCHAHTSRFGRLFNIR